MQQLSVEMEEDLREKSSKESLIIAAERLPGRVIRHLMEPALQASRSWPSECPPRTVVPRCLVVFVKDFLTQMGMQYDDGMIKQLQASLFDKSDVAEKHS